MTDDSDTDSADGSTPGGGPNRVVSETSVDDILDSINSSPEPDRDDKDETSGRSEETGRDGIADSSECKNESEPDPAVEIEPDVVGDSVPDTTTIETGHPADPAAVVADADSSPESDGSANSADITDGDTISDSPNPESSLDDTDPDLSSRIELGEVTGSDVRAAEAGEGREETTDIGDIELSMDDLESTTGASDTSSSGGRPSTDGPLSGTINTPATEPEAGDVDEAGESESDETSSGLFGRLKGLFSR